VIALSLPAIAVDIGNSPRMLKLAITSCLLSLKAFIPASMSEAGSASVSDIQKEPPPHPMGGASRGRAPPSVVKITGMAFGKPTRSSR